MKVLDNIKCYCDLDLIAITNGNEHVSYKTLWEESNNLAGYIKQNTIEREKPIIVYGHKHPKMVAAFLACAKSGHPYVPIDINMPSARVNAIIDAVNPELIITTEVFEGFANECKVIDIKNNYFSSSVTISEEDYVKDNEVFYIIFTSGSTGNPKGVQITYESLNNFVEWALTIGKKDTENSKVYIDQAPFSFDLSVMDLYPCLASGSTLFSLKKEVQNDYKLLFEQLKESNATTWVSTPSFAEMCLVDDSFSQELLPNMGLFLFCGEMLTNKTAAKLIERFPKAEVYNTYGPTESTVAVTAINITNDIIEKYNPLPIGYTKPGTVIIIMDGESEIIDGQAGEIIIAGNTVSKGYLNSESNNKGAFFSIKCNDKEIPAYRTGDKGYVVDDLLFYSGRIDFQVKLHGYRMELEDIEKNIMKVHGVKQAIVVPVYEEGKVKYLKAICNYNGLEGSNLKAQKEVKKELKMFLPDYMIPKKVVFLTEFPMTTNGKIDRKKLQENN